MATTKKILGKVPVNRGEYSSTEYYYKDNLVQKNNVTYICKSNTAIIGIEPSDTTKWDIFAGAEIVQEYDNSINKVLSSRGTKVAIENVKSDIRHLIESGYLYVGVGNTEMRVPENSQQKIFYILDKKGHYTNLENVTVTNKVCLLLWNLQKWSLVETEIPILQGVLSILGLDYYSKTGIVSSSSRDPIRFINTIPKGIIRFTLTCEEGSISGYKVLSYNGVNPFGTNADIYLPNKTYELVVIHGTSSYIMPWGAYVNQEYLLKDSALCTFEVLYVNELADGSVTSAKLADGSVNQNKIADNSVTANKIINGSIMTEKIHDDSVTPTKIPNASIVAEDKIVNDLLFSAPKIANIIKELYIAPEDIPSDINSDKEFYLRQIYYKGLLNGVLTCRIMLKYKNTSGTLMNSFILDSSNEKGINMSYAFGVNKKSYAVINWSELADMGQTATGQILFDDTGKYKFKTSRILNKRNYQTVSASIEDGVKTLTQNLETLTQRVDSVIKPNAYELFTIGDSLCASGKWQTKTAELLNIKFEQSKNADPSYPTSIGGTNSYMSNKDSTYFRTLNLINHGGITGKGENAIIVFQNSNDREFVFDSSVKSFKLDKDYDISSLTTENLTAINRSNRVFNAVANVKNLSKGKKLTITKVPTREGDVGIKTGWAGPGISTYYIHVVPQATEALTKQYIIDKFVEYSYKGIYDSDAGDGESVLFTCGRNDYETTLQFWDNGTGMQATITDVDNAPWHLCYWYKGNSLDDTDWGTVNNWDRLNNPSYGWKSAIEELRRTYPLARIYIANLPSIMVTVSNYYDNNRGLYNESAFSEAIQSRKEAFKARNQAIADFYNIKMLDVWGLCNYTASNFSEFYPAASNPHPLDAGYKQWGRAVASLLKSEII